MVNWLIRWCLGNRFLVMLAALAILMALAPCDQQPLGPDWTQE